LKLNVNVDSCRGATGGSKMREDGRGRKKRMRSAREAVKEGAGAWLQPARDFMNINIDPNPERYQRKHDPRNSLTRNLDVAFIRSLGN